MWIGRPKQRDRGDMEAGGEMGQSGIMPDKTISMSDDSGDRKKIKTLQYPNGVRIGALKGCDLIIIRRSTDHERRNPIAFISFQEIGKQPWSRAFMAASASGMDDYERLRGHYSTGLQASSGFCHHLERQPQSMVLSRLRYDRCNGVEKAVRLMNQPVPRRGGVGRCDEKMRDPECVKR